MNRSRHMLWTLGLLLAGCGHGHSSGSHSHSAGPVHSSSSHTSSSSHSGGGGSGCGSACGILVDILAVAADASEVAVDVAEAERERDAVPLPPPLPLAAPAELKNAMQAAMEMLSASDYPQFLARSVEPGPEVTAATEQSLRDGLGAQLLSATAACSQRGPEMSADGNAARCTGPDGNSLWWIWTQSGWVMVLHAP